MDDYQANLAQIIASEGFPPALAELVSGVLLSEGVTAARANGGLPPGSFVQLTPGQLAQVVARCLRAALAPAPAAPLNPFAPSTAAAAPTAAPALVGGRSKGLSPLHTFVGPASGVSTAGAASGPRVEIRDANGQITASGLVSSFINRPVAAVVAPSTYAGQLQDRKSVV